MENSTLLAKFIGPFIVVIGVSVLFNVKNYRQIMEDFFKNSALVYISGLVIFVAGLAVVLAHNQWAWDWRVIITLFGWIILIKGAWLVIFPGISAKRTGVFVKNVKWVAIPWAIMLAIGIFLVVKGYCPSA